MENRLFPVFDIPSAPEETAVERYPSAPLWDTETGDFVTDGAGRVLSGSGYNAWALWCTKEILTQRWAHLSYSANTGIEANEAFGESDRAASESAFERTITEALLADPLGRTVQVGDFVFEWEADSLRVRCTAVGKDGTAVSVTAALNR